jgi:hypothetical protein
MFNLSDKSTSNVINSDMTFVKYVATSGDVQDPVLSFPIWNNSTPSLLIKLTALALQQDNTILPSGSREHPVKKLPLVLYL